MVAWPRDYPPWPGHLARQVKQDLTQLTAAVLLARQLIRIRAQNLLGRCLRRRAGAFVVRRC
jgi:hypothetical protein